MWYFGREITRCTVMYGIRCMCTTLANPAYDVYINVCTM